MIVVDRTEKRTGKRTRVEIPETKDVGAVLEAIGARYGTPVSEDERRARDARFEEMLERRRNPGPESKVEPAPAHNVHHARRKIGGGVRDASMEAHRAIRGGGRMADQQRLIVEHLRARPGEKFTRQELARDLGLGINAVCGRVNELVAEPFELLLEDGRKRCSVTGNDVGALRLA